MFVSLLVSSVVGADDTIPAGTYEGTTGGTYVDRGSDTCTVDEIRRLTLTINTDGTALWSGFYRIDGSCRASQYERKATVPPLPGDRVIWKCGMARVVLPDTEPQPKGCVRLGRYVDHRDQQAADLYCQASPTDFPELADTIVTRNGKDLKVAIEVARVKKTATLVRQAAPKPDPDFFCASSSDRSNGACVEDEPTCEALRKAAGGGSTWSACKPQPAAQCFVYDADFREAWCAPTADACVATRELLRKQTPFAVGDCFEQTSKHLRGRLTPPHYDDLPFFDTSKVKPAHVFLCTTSASDPTIGSCDHELHVCEDERARLVANTTDMGKCQVTDSAFCFDYDVIHDPQHVDHVSRCASTIGACERFLLTIDKRTANHLSACLEHR